MNEEAIFDEVLSIPPDDRADYLDKICGDDAVLRARLEARLVEHDRMEEVRCDSVSAIESTQDLDSTGQHVDQVIGQYRLLDRIGEGGMGVVFVAEQQHPLRRKVAVKIIKPGMDSKEVIARFEAERQALALMDHPHIAHVLDAGTTDSGRPFFAMELVRGMPITDYCDRHKLTVHERLALFLPACGAVQHAHQKGIIHRDLKPSNVLVTLHDGKPIPKIIDFGVAKAVNQQLTDHTVYTRFSQVIGTPMYMSPEQADLSSFDVDTRSDVYSLGILLYELLTGTTPFDKALFRKATYDEIRRIVSEKDPVKPSTKINTLSSEDASLVSTRRSTDLQNLRRQVSGDLDWIVLKAVEKDRSRRYETAIGLASDIERHLCNKPVKACPPSAGYLIQKLVRRHRGAVLAASLILLALLAAVVGTTTGMFRARIESERANDAERRALRQLYVADMNVARQAWLENDFDRSLEILLKYGSVPENKEDLRGFEWYHLWQLCDRGLTAKRKQLEVVALAVDFSPDGSKLAVGHPGNRVSVLDVASLEHQDSFGEVYERLDEAQFLGYSPDGEMLACPGDGDEPNVVLLRTLKTGRTVRLVGHAGPVRGVAFSPSEQLIATASADETVMLWHVETGMPAAKPLGDRVFGQGYDGASRYLPDCKAVWSVAFSPDGKTIASGHADGITRIWDRHNSEEVRHEFKRHRRPVWSVKFAPQGPRRLVTASADKTAKIWNPETGEEVATLVGHTDMIRGLAISPDGETIATAGRDNTVRLWNMADGRLEEMLRGHNSLVQDVAISPDGQYVASASLDYSVMLWGLRSRHPEAIRGKRIVRWLGLHENTIVCLTRTGQVEHFDVETGELLQPTFLAGKTVTSIRVSPSGIMAAGYASGQVAVFTLGSSSLPDTLMHGSPVQGVALSRDGLWLASAGSDGSLRLWRKGESGWHSQHELSDRIVYQYTERTPLVFDKNGKRLAYVSAGHTIKVLDVDSGESMAKPLKGHKDTILAMAFSEDGTRLASGSFDNTARLWDLGAPDPSKKPVVLTGHSASVRALAFSRDGRTLYTAAGDRYVKLWDLETQRERFSLGPHDAAIMSMAVASDESTIVAGTVLGTIRIWRTAAQKNATRLQRQAMEYLSEQKTLTE